MPHCSYNLKNNAIQEAWACVLTNWINFEARLAGIVGYFSSSLTWPNQRYEWHIESSHSNFGRRGHACSNPKTIRAPVTSMLFASCSTPTNFQQSFRPDLKSGCFSTSPVISKSLRLLIRLLAAPREFGSVALLPHGIGPSSNRSARC